VRLTSPRVDPLGVTNLTLRRPRSPYDPPIGTTTSTTETRRRPSDGGRRGLQATLGVLALIPFRYGLAGMLEGPRSIPGNRISVDASFDSEYRFVHAFWFAAAPVIWSTLSTVETDPPALEAAMATVVVGGIARLISWRQSGRPRPIFVGGIVLELAVVPALWRWKSRVVRAARPASPPPASPARPASADAEKG
jgi:uncharacterized protein DUF4345